MTEAAATVPWLFVAGAIFAAPILSFVIISCAFWIGKLMGRIGARMDGLEESDKDLRGDLLRLRAESREDMKRMRGEWREGMERMRDDRLADLERMRDERREGMKWIVTGPRVDGEESCGEFVGRMDGIQTTLTEIFSRLAPASALATRDNSPLTLTTIGEKISAVGDAREWAREHARVLGKEIEGKEDFEVYEMCVAHVEKCYEEDEAFNRRVRYTIYECATNLEEVLSVYQVELRDRLFSERRLVRAKGT